MPVILGLVRMVKVRIGFGVNFSIRIRVMSTVREDQGVWNRSWCNPIDCGYMLDADAEDLWSQAFACMPASYINVYCKLCLLILILIPTLAASSLNFGFRSPTHYFIHSALENANTNRDHSIACAAVFCYLHSFLLMRAGNCTIPMWQSSFQGIFL